MTFDVQGCDGDVASRRARMREKDNRAMKYWLAPAMIAMGFLVGAIAALAPVLEATWLGLASERWPAAQAIVIESRESRGGRRMVGSVIIRYSYEVDGERFVGSKAQAFDNVFSTRSQRLAVLREYRVGRWVQVRYDPRRPQRAVLRPGVRFVSIAAGSLMGVFFLTVSAFFLYFGFRPGRSSR